MGQFAREVLEVSAQLFPRAKATEQGGVLSGDNPVVYNASDPFRLWVIQVALIIFMTQVLTIFLSRLRQPRVVSEVIGGIILGPTVMGRIPHFRDKIFPDAGMPLLSLTSTVGLVIYLFLVALEIDVRIVKRYAASSMWVSIAGLVFPLGLGAAIGVAIYREFVSPSIDFGTFILFVAVAVGITAFPVLCRILTELKLLDTSVGIVTLSAGVGNDIVGWVLLALTVALVNASSGLTALWVLICSVAYVVFLLYPGRWAYIWLARRTGSLEQGSPTTGMMTITLFIVLVSAFFTDIIGVHAIFGGFLSGLIIPHENGYAISMVEKLESLVSIVLIPIYFTLSGLKTDLGLLNTGISWGYTILLCLVSFVTKFCGCGLAALLGKFDWRESGAIGSLMSCKGLVELIVLNVGLQAQILDTRTFSMFVVHALILTAMTTPLVILFYPERVRKHESTAFKGGHGQEDARPRPSTSYDGFKTKISIVLDKIEQLPPAMMLSQLVNVIPAGAVKRVKPLDEKTNLMESDSINQSLSRTSSSSYSTSIRIDALRLIELSTRTSAILKSQEAESLIHNDSVISIFRTFGALNKLAISVALSIINYDEFPEAISRHARDSGSQLVILPWSRGNASVHESESQISVQNPFDGVFPKSNLHVQDQTNSVVYSEFIRGVFSKSPTDVALYLDRGLGRETAPTEHHIFLPFFGGPDDRLALSFLVQLCHNPMVTATVIRISKADDLSPISTIAEAKGAPAADVSQHVMLAAADTVYGNQSTQSRLASSTADSLIWNKYATATSEDRSSTLMTALSRIKFGVEASSTPLRTAMDLSMTTLTQNPGKNVTVFLGRSRRMAVESHEVELRQIILEAGGHMGPSVPKTLGDVGAALVAKGIHTSLLVMQTAIETS